MYSQQPALWAAVIVALWLLPWTCPPCWLTGQHHGTQPRLHDLLEGSLTLATAFALEMLPSFLPFKPFYCEREGSGFPGCLLFTLSSQKVPGNLKLPMAPQVGRPLVPVQSGDPGPKRVATCHPPFPQRQASSQRPG